MEQAPVGKVAHGVASRADLLVYSVSAPETKIDNRIFFIHIFTVSVNRKGQHESQMHIRLVIFT